MNEQTNTLETTAELRKDLTHAVLAVSVAVNLVAFSAWLTFILS